MQHIIVIVKTSSGREVAMLVERAATRVLEDDPSGAQPSHLAPHDGRSRTRRLRRAKTKSRGPKTILRARGRGGRVHARVKTSNGSRLTIENARFVDKVAGIRVSAELFMKNS